MRKLVTSISACLLVLLSVVSASAQDRSAVVLVYHRFGEDNVPSTNIRLEQFDTHIAELTNGNYNPLPLSEIVRRLKAREPLPEKTVTITVDDAFRSVYEEGWPRLRAAGLPLTLFVSTDPVDEGHPNYMTWDQIRTLQAEGVEIGHHTASHLHMIHSGTEQSLEDVRRASERFEEELGAVPPMFAYPYGEYDSELMQEIQSLGFDAAFAQFSGPAAFWSNMYSLPRFAVNERFGDIGRFRLIASTKALPIEDLTPLNPVVTAASNPPLYGFTVDMTIGGLSAMACYPSHLGRAADLLMPSRNRLEVRFEEPLPPGRSRINCTMPAGGGRWYWLGSFFYVPGGPLD